MKLYCTGFGQLLESLFECDEIPWFYVKKVQVDRPMDNKLPETKTAELATDCLSSCCMPCSTGGQHLRDYAEVVPPGRWDRSVLRQRTRQFRH